VELSADRIVESGELRKPALQVSRSHAGIAVFLDIPVDRIGWII
jgi:hypothetical protein